MPEEVIPPEEPPGIAVVGSSPREPVRPRGRKRRRARLRGTPRGTATVAPGSAAGASAAAASGAASVWVTASGAPSELRGSPSPESDATSNTTTAPPTGAGPAGRAAAGAAGEAGAADEADEADEDRSWWTPPRRGRGAYRPGTVPTWLAIGLAALAVTASVLAIIFGLAWSNLDSTAGQATDAKNVASEFLTKFTNFQPSNIDADFSALQNLATGNFARQATQYFGSSSLRQRLAQAQAQSQGQIRNIYVEKLAGGKAQVYAVVDQTYTNSQIRQSGGSPVPDTLRLQINLTQVSGTWKISDVTVLSGPPSATPSAGQ